ncbi:MAG: carboxypeptidase-like regulatory domain-containing protein [Planctomycetaceae bacterium]|jgi:hypothetical protein|nr:carboxypeptidase-like regulatory domain-containing protein [Planctomycetaceae bacterium]
MKTSTFIVLSILICLGLSGCRQEMERCTVQGMVTFQGKPVANATVIIRPEAGSDAGAITDADGKFVIPKNEGPMPGNVQIMVEKFTTAEEKGSDGRMEKIFKPALPPNVQSQQKPFTLTHGTNKIDLNLDSW